MASCRTVSKGTITGSLVGEISRCLTSGSDVTAREASVDRRRPTSQSGHFFPRELAPVLGSLRGNMASALEQFVNSVRQLSAQGEALGRPSGPRGRACLPSASGSGGTALAVPSVVSGAGFAAALRPRRDQACRARQSWSGPLALSGSVAPPAKPCARQSSRRLSRGPSGPLLPALRPQGPLCSGASLDIWGAVTSVERLRERPWSRGLPLPAVIGALATGSRSASVPGGGQQASGEPFLGSLAQRLRLAAARLLSAPSLVLQDVQEPSLVGRRF